MKRIIKTALSLLLTVGLLLPAGLYYVTSAEETTGQVAEPTLKPEEPLEEDIEALAKELIDELRYEKLRRVLQLFFCNKIYLRERT